MKHPNNADLKKWEARVLEETKQTSLNELVWNTAEGIPIKPIYTFDDIKNSKSIDALPGLEPFLRGPRSSMYLGKPWTCLLYTSPSPRDLSTSRMPSSA